MFVSVSRDGDIRPCVPCLQGVGSLPHMPLPELVRHMRGLTPAEAAHVRKHRFLPLPGRGLWRPCVITDALSHRAALEQGCCVVARADARDFSLAMQQAWNAQLVDDAAHALRRTYPVFSAVQRFSRAQKEVLSLAALVVAALALLAPRALLVALGLTFGLFYLAMAALHVSAAASRWRASVPPLLKDHALPVYTVLAPLYREAAVLGQLLQALARLDYPAKKLDIKLLVEEDDGETRAALRGFVLPPHMEVLVVPRGAPRTKPRALNHGLAFARGELLTIYDAEDVPHPGQLRVAASCFAVQGADMACLQAPLGWYNATASFFSRMLAVDYAAHFHVILPWLHKLGLPLPLGGTSNHFRVAALREAGAWDPFNVTEDADLGLRLARKGWRTGVLPAGIGTQEEACTEYACWRHQRARWIKGWLQTFLVHQRMPTQLMHEVGAGGYFVLYALLGAGVFAALLHPFFLALTLATLLHPGVLFPGFMSSLLAAMGMVVFVAGYTGAFLSAREGLRRTGQRRLLPWLVFLPFYWLLVSLAAWLALWDFIRRPHHWRKTAHGAFLLLK